MSRNGTPWSTGLHQGEGNTVTEGMLFGIQTPTQKPWPELAAQWTWLEELGFDSIWLADHYVPPFKLDGPIFEPWTLLAALALQTERVRLGVLVSCNTFRHPPLVAKEAVTVDHISHGRLEFGLGAGWFVPEHEMFGIPFPSNTELIGRFREAVEICHRLFTQDVTTYEGEYYQVRDAPFRPAPLQPRLPFTLGAHRPRMMRIVARYADRWNSTGTLEEMAERVVHLDEACAEVGRDPGEILRSHLYVPGILPHERPFDSPDAFRDFAGRLREIGVREAILQPPATLPREQMELIAATASELKAVPV
jgi:alkanesulfonate monooxygenase SsuD/methylene tetrahydromethanopterin reductase-like flavin-dependent oxidoreductase (luciferase family)